MVELKAKRHLKAIRKFEVSVPSNIAENRVNLLNDGVAQCYPDNELYFTTVQEQYPMIEIDLKMTRIVKGVVIYLRVDALAPELDGKGSCVSNQRNYSWKHGRELKLYNRVFARLCRLLINMLLTLLTNKIRNSHNFRSNTVDSYCIFTIIC